MALVFAAFVVACSLAAGTTAAARHLNEASSDQHTEATGTQQPVAEESHQPAEAGHEAPQGEHAAPAEHGSSIWSVVAKLLNFAILAGTLVYFLRTPLSAYMRDRAATIRQDLVTARQMKVDAQTQLDEIDARMKALPAELEALKTRGAREIAAEEQRILRTAEAERERLLDQTRRELDLQLRTAKRELVAHAADLAVNLASDRIKGSITQEDHERLAARYIRDVSESGGAS